MRISTYLTLAALCAAAAFAVSLPIRHSSAEDARVIAAPRVDEAAPTQGKLEVAVLAGGCFWGVQGVFQHVKGVKNAVSGYAGGNADTAEYETVGTGTTGHAESVEITYDPAQITYGRLLQIYFSVATDPTELNRQGPDVGTQYRSTIFAMSDEQAKIATSYIAELNAAKPFARPIATTVETGKSFYRAEDYHQDFLALHPSHPYIVVNDLPKVESLKGLFPNNYRDDPVLVASAKPTN